MTWKESCIPGKTVKQSAKTTKLQISCEASAKPISFWKALQNIFWNVRTLIDTICCNKRLKTSVFFPYHNLLKWQRCYEISPGQRSRNTRKKVLRFTRLWLSHNWHVLTLVIINFVWIYICICTIKRHLNQYQQDQPQTYWHIGFQEKYICWWCDCQQQSAVCKDIKVKRQQHFWWSWLQVT